MFYGFAKVNNTFLLKYSGTLYPNPKNSEGMENSKHAFITAENAEKIG